MWSVSSAYFYIYTQIGFGCICHFVVQLNYSVEYPADSRFWLMWPIWMMNVLCTTHEIGILAIAALSTFGWPSWAVLPAQPGHHVSILLQSSVCTRHARADRYGVHNGNYPFYPSISKAAAIDSSMRPTSRLFSCCLLSLLSLFSLFSLSSSNFCCCRVESRLWEATAILFGRSVRLWNTPVSRHNLTDGRVMGHEPPQHHFMPLFLTFNSVTIRCDTRHTYTAQSSACAGHESRPTHSEWQAMMLCHSILLKEEMYFSVGGGCV